MVRIPRKTIRPLDEVRVVLPRQFFNVLFGGVTWDRTKANFEFRWESSDLIFSVVVDGEHHGFKVSRNKAHGKIRILPLSGNDSSFYVYGWEEAAERIKNVIQAKRAGQLMATGEKVPISILCKNGVARRCKECDDLTCEQNKVVEKARQA